jgi:hypothetical protein
MKFSTILSAFSLSICLPSTAATFTIQPTTEAASKETKVYVTVPTSNFSSNLNLVSADITDFRSLLQFDLSAMVGVNSADISTAVIRLYVTGFNTNNVAGNTSANISVSPISSAWKENAADAGSAPLATWDALFGASPTITYGSAVSSQTATAVGFWDFDVTNLVKSWQDASVANHGVLLQTVGTGQDVGIADVDSTPGVPGSAPALIVTTVPEPSAALLLGLLSLGSGLRRRVSTIAR